jgi:hypothetical protein
MLNVVIAIIGDTFDSVVQKQDITFKRELATIFVENEGFIDFDNSTPDPASPVTNFSSHLHNGLIPMVANNLRTMLQQFVHSRSTIVGYQSNPAWLHVLQPVIQSEDVAQEWSGKVTAITNKLSVMETELLSKIDALDKKLLRARLTAGVANEQQGELAPQLARLVDARFEAMRNAQQAELRALEARLSIGAV